jgi:hypothetical protein
MPVGATPSAYRAQIRAARRDAFDEPYNYGVGKRGFMIHHQASVNFRSLTIRYQDVRREIPRMVPS